jgi:tetratricopeptide (TPR) repeat protein
MKKQIIAISLGLMSIGMFAQKKELRTIDKAIDKNDFKTAKEGIAALESNESAIEEKYEAWYYYLKGSAYGKSNVEKAVAAYDKLFAIEKESGKAKYTEEAKPKLNELIQFVSNKAVTAYNDDKDYATATKNFYLTYKLSPTDTSFLYNAAVSASLQKDYETSFAYYQELQDIGYTGVTTQYFAVEKETGVKENLGGKKQRDLMVKTGQYITPTNENTKSKQAEIIKNLSFILIAQGKTDEAIVAIKEARKNEPKDLNLLLNEAQLYIKLEKMDKFQELMEEAVQLDPENPTLFFNLGVVNQNQGKTKEAIEYYKKAIELNPKYADAYMNLSVAILAGEQAIVEEMNKNLSNFKKYDELEKKQKELYQSALPYLEKADELGRTEDTVKSLLNIYDLTGNKKAETLRPIYKKMRGM